MIGLGGLIHKFRNLALWKHKFIKESRKSMIKTIGQVNRDMYNFKILSRV